MVKKAKKAKKDAVSAYNVTDRAIISGAQSAVTDSITVDNAADQPITSEAQNTETNSNALDTAVTPHGDANIHKTKVARTTSDSGITPRITRAMALSASRHAVLETTELLESILVYLPFKELFVIQRVSRRFRDVIASSNQLQTKMFLRSCMKRES